MSKASRLARPASAGAGSKLPSPRKECPGSAGAAGRARVLTVGEKLMRAGSDSSILTRQKSLTAPQDKGRSETQADTQAAGERGPNVESAPPKSRMCHPKASSQQQGSVHSEYNQKSSSPPCSTAVHVGLWVSLLFSPFLVNFLVNVVFGGLGLFL